MNYMELADELLRNMQNLRKFKHHKNISEVMQGEAFVLNYIAFQGGEDVLPGEIGEHMHVSSARVATALNSLENKGLIIRRIDKKDRRKIIVSLTQEGKDLAENMRKEALEDAACLLSSLGEHDAGEYVRITGRLAEITLKNK